MAGVKRTRRRNFWNWHHDTHWPTTNEIRETLAPFQQATIRSVVTGTAVIRTLGEVIDPSTRGPEVRELTLPQPYRGFGPAVSWFDPNSLWAKAHEAAERVTRERLAQERRARQAAAASARSRVATSPEGRAAALWDRLAGRDQVCPSCRSPRVRISTLQPVGWDIPNCYCESCGWRASLVVAEGEPLTAAVR